MKCAHCNNEVEPEDGMVYCPHCGAAFGATEPDAGMPVAFGPPRFPDAMPVSWVYALSLVAAAALDIFLLGHQRGLNVFVAGAAGVLMWWTPLRRRGLTPPLLPFVIFASVCVALSAQSSGAADRAFYLLWFSAFLYYSIECRNRLLGVEGRALTPLMSRVGGLFAEAAAEAGARPAAADATPSRTRQVALGLLVAVPLVLIIFSLMSSADELFSREVSELFGRLEHWPGHLFRIVCIAVVVFAGTGLKALARERGPIADAHPIAKFPLLSATIVLGALALALGFFLAVHLRTLSMSEKEIFEQTGMIFRTYIRRGFSELLAAEIIVGTTLLVVLHTREWEAESGRGHRLLAWTLVALTALMSCSCALRLYYYVDEYGLTLVRSLNAVGIAVSFACLAFVAVRAADPLPLNVSIGRILRITLVFFTAWSCLLPVRMIAEYNARKYASGHQVELRYFRHLGPDAYPAFERAMQYDPSAGKTPYREYIKTWAVLEKERLKTATFFEWNPATDPAMQSLDKIIERSGGNINN